MRTSEQKVNGDANFCDAHARKSVGDLSRLVCDAGVTDDLVGFLEQLGRSR